MISAAILEEEETQIGGVATIIDNQGTTMRQTSLFSVTDIIDFSNCLKMAVGRYKQLYLVSLPTFAVFLLDVAKTTLSEKLKQRIVLPKNMEDMKNYIDPSLLPKECGGKFTQEQHMEAFNEHFQTVHHDLEAIRASEIDWPKVPESRNIAEAVGSFRKLEID